MHDDYLDKGMYMKSNCVKFLTFGMAVLFYTAVLTGCFKTERIDSSDTATAEIGAAAPDFTIEMNDGSSFTLSEAVGKVVLVNLWATWCGPCCEELPAFQRLHDEYGDDLQIVAVNYAESKETVDQFVKENGYTFPFAYDTEGMVAELYPSNGIPYTIIIDGNGNISQTFLGARSADEQYEIYKTAIEEALNVCE